jgi:hypothetical protein
MMWLTVIVRLKVSKFLNSQAIAFWEVAAIARDESALRLE